MTTRKRNAQLTEVVFPEHANHYGTLFGGNALNLMAKAAFLAARAFTRRDVVMAACSDARFLSPVRLGSVLTLDARVVRVGRSAMTVRVTGTADSHVGVTDAEHECTAVLEGSFELVVVDTAGRPSQIAESLRDEFNAPTELKEPA